MRMESIIELNAIIIALIWTWFFSYHHALITTRCVGCVKDNETIESTLLNKSTSITIVKK